MKIYGHPMSTCTRKVLMTLAETNTQHELEVVDFAKGEHKQPAYLAHQPFGQLPALDDEGLALYESRAMARYIDDKAGHKLVPVDAKKRALVEQWISVESSNFTPHAMKYVYKHIFQRPVEDAVMETAAAGLDNALGVMETQLAKTPFIAGDEFTLADVTFMPYFEYAMNTPAKDKITAHPHVAAWWNKVSERPTWRKVANRA